MIKYDKKCEFCGKNFTVDAKHEEKRFCSRRCGSKSTAAVQREKRLQQWLDGGVWFNPPILKIGKREIVSSVQI